MVASESSEKVGEAEKEYMFDEDKKRRARADKRVFQWFVVGTSGNETLERPDVGVSVGKDPVR